MRHYRHFRDELYKGEDLALRAAQVWRDNIIREHVPPTRQERAAKIIQTNKTGIAGVTCWVDSDGVPTLWRAKTRIGDLVLQKAFSVSRWGNDARSLAIHERAMQLQQMEGLAYVHPHEAPLREATAELTAPLPSAKTWIELGVARTNNRSGSPGVTRRKGLKAHPGYWTAQATINGKWTSKSFSIAIYGEQGAKARAVVERTDQVRRTVEARTLTKNV